MERTKQKSKKEKPNKYLEKEKSSSFISDVKAFKENLKIREILKTVKMNSSMRIKAPRGSKVMQNKDFNDNEDIFDDVDVSGGQQVDELPSATNTVLNNENASEIVHEESTEEEEIIPILIENEIGNDSSVFPKSKSLSDGIDGCSNDDVTPNTLEFPLLPGESTGAKSRDRKLSLDHTMLLRREGFSQSEIDLNSIGKSPLERKSSFFRKKMDSFVRNTTEIFKRQSMSSKSTRSPVTTRRDSTSSRMSVSLQSLNENSAFFEEFKNVPLNTYRDQQSSASSLATPRTDSMISINVNDRLLEQAEVDTMAGSPLPEDQLADTPSTSTHSLNKEPIQDSLLSTRAISMSSGLDTATGQRRRKTSRSNRVSWLASESLTDYFRRLIQDEKSTEIQGWQSYQDFSAIPENRVGSKIDSKGRRLSYMRAVSGEDPSVASSFRKKKFMESEVPRTHSELERQLARYLKDGVPPLDSYQPYDLPEEARRFMKGAATEDGYMKLFPRRGNTTPAQDTLHAILQELVVTEAQYIQHLKVIVDLYMATAHSLQNKGFLLDINSWMVFSHMPDIYNSAMKFWEVAIYPMLRQAKKDGRLDPELIIPGFLEFSKIFEPYRNYMQQQTTSTEYLRIMNMDPEFACYINWCHQQANNRLQLPDILIKPVQRLTKYGLIIARLADHVADKVIAKKLKLVENLAKSYVSGVNRSVRQKEEYVKLDEMRIDAYEPEYRGDEEVEKTCRQHAIIDLHLPMIDCGTVGRCLIHSGVMRYKDSMKEFDAHVLLFTDMMLICKKLPKIKEKDKEKYKKEYSHWKMLRPKIMLNRLLPSYDMKADLSALVYVILDELGSSLSVFQLSESPKDSLGANTAKVWQLKIFEAMVTYVLTKWYVKHPPRILTIVERTFSIEDSEKSFSRRREASVTAVEKRARERVAAMLHGREKSETIQEKYQETEFELRLMTEYAKYYPDMYNSQTAHFCSTIYTAIYTDTVWKAHQAEMEYAEGAAGTQSVASVPAVTRRRSSMVAAVASGIKGPNDNFTRALIAARGDKRPPNIYAMFETGIAQYVAGPPPTVSQYVVMSSAGSSILRSSSELHFSMSCGSHDELGTEHAQRSGSALEPIRPALFVDDGVYRSPAIKVHMVPENTQSLLPSPLSVRAPTLVLQESSPNHSPGPRSASAGAGSDNTLRVASAATLVHSMPDINTEIRRILSANLEPRPTPLTASERLYRSHQELMHKNRLAAGQHYLKPDHRGSSYPPPSPRALQRGDAVSFSFRHPPLTRTKNVPERASTSQLESTSRIFGRRSLQSDLANGAKSPRRQRSPSPIPRAVPPPGEKPEKRKSLFLRRNKDSQNNPEYDECDADDRSCRSTQEKGKHRVARSIAKDGSTTTDDQDDVESQDSPKKDKDKG